MIEKVDRELRAVYNDMKRIDATESLKLRGKREKIFCFPLCDSLRPDRISNPQREPGGPQPSGQGRVQIRWRQNDYCRVFQPSHARAGIRDSNRFAASEFARGLGRRAEDLLALAGDCYYGQAEENHEAESRSFCHVFPSVLETPSRRCVSRHCIRLAVLDLLFQLYSCDSVLESTRPLRPGKRRLMRPLQNLSCWRQLIL